MASNVVVCSHQTLSAFPRPLLLNTNTSGRLRLCRLFYPIRRPPLRIHFSRRPSNFSKEGKNWDSDPGDRSRRRSGFVNGGYSVVDDDDDEDEDDEDEDEDRSLDLLIRFVQNIFKKVSRRARKAVRSVLPVPISSQLVAFSVNGIIILTFMWVLKAFLEVVCTLGSVVFVSILVIRGIWTGISYLQENRNYRPYELDDERRTWTGSQPAT